SVEFFGERPHLLLPFDFDESLGFVDPSYLIEEIDPYHELETNAAIDAAVDSAMKEAEQLYGWYPVAEFCREYLFRKPTGSWHWFEGLDRGQLRFHCLPSLDVCNLIDKLQRIIDSPDTNPHSLWLQKIWTPRRDQRGAFLFDRRARLVVCGMVRRWLSTTIKQGKQWVNVSV
ncbi:MAG: hypothetical protein ABJ059_18775, partial [Hyphomicrobiales bacterium]